MDCKILNFQNRKDDRGSLIVLENLKEVPFEIKRVYYIFDTDPKFPRGAHAHKNLEQILIMMCGSCDIVLDNGKKKKKICLNRPDVGLYIGKNIWREMKNFSYGAKLLVLASDFYDEKEYIRDYNEFLKVLNAK
ncbi:WxcM-like domain-containing protein [Campylobacter sp. RM10532]|uniref:class E lipooligosaccharide biosynthesis 3,4-ketoisomerase WlaRB n=1 Tax=Campylobacter molothri TaxID=1032242 RepID=UPI0019055026|nr:MULTISPECIES: class E lipooligosaccharide biosynthesis 3,4-ketoisomerase WlaRB [unclassified Campylobacter]MBZ7937909.1 WxcM-like domain-containing protein [Campylobacter sp. RM10538]MBZ7945629.1 WxcM-like domain-containing protein [Campylobacter sp. RM10532]MBZ7949042.1 WxcM-like domain-containing protein [Campylobacter sp. RM10534]MBZ7959203.1 WxcM-like domain-containing protein [Campylobacter sp. RM12397]MBK2000462.1 WxcM-like domain-containing protein [Campylobacter sp. 2018MI35]